MPSNPRAPLLTLAPDPYADPRPIQPEANHRGRLADAQWARAEAIDGLNLDHCVQCGVEWIDGRGFAHDVNCPWFQK